MYNKAAYFLWSNVIEPPIMKITVERDELLRALNHIQGLVEKRNTVPILSNILLDVNDNKLRISATENSVDSFITGASEILCKCAGIEPLKE